MKHRRKQWEATTLAASLERAPEREGPFTTISGMPIERLYGPEDLGPGWDPEDKLGWPGEYPYTRGIHPTMYRGRLWTMRQFAGFGTAEQTNARFRYLLEQGQGGLSVAFDLPTLMGRDSDDPMSKGEVGREGVAIDTLDMIGSPKDARIIVLNRADTKVGLRPDDVESAIKTGIAVNIPNSLTVPASVNRGVPIVLDDAATQEDTDDFMLTAGIGLAGGGAVGSLVMFLLPRRRRSQA